MSITVFNRYEKKFLVKEEQYNEVIKRLEEYMIPDGYSKDGGFYSISNIYYDTEDDELIRKSIERPIYKEKLRLRSYGKPGLQDEAFIEIKKKFKGNVNKRRITLPLCEAVDYLDRDIIPKSVDPESQIFKEIQFMRQRYKLIPKVYLSYDRRAYFGKEDKEFRVTFDTNIQARRTELDLTAGAYGMYLLPEGYWIMEIKVLQGMPMWLTQMLSELKIYKTSFSKYGTEYKGLIKRNTRRR